MEENFRRALIISRGDFATFVERPISLRLLAAALVLLASALLPAVRKTRETRVHRIGRAGALAAAGAPGVAFRCVRATTEDIR